MIVEPWMHPGGDDPADSNTDRLPWAPEWSWRPGNRKVGALDASEWAAILERCREAEAAEARKGRRAFGYRKWMTRRGKVVL